MIHAEQFKCSVPPGTSIKDGAELICAGFPATPVSDSATWAAWATAIFTLGLLIGAVVAGVIAYRNLKELERQTQIAAETSASAARLAAEGRQFQALIDYQSAWSAVNPISGTAWATVDSTFANAVAKGKLWRAIQWEHRTELERFELLEISIHGAIRRAKRVSPRPTQHVWVKHDISLAISTLTRAAAEWQHSPREAKEALLARVESLTIALDEQSSYLDGSEYAQGVTAEQSS